VKLVLVILGVAVLVGVAVRIMLSGASLPRRRRGPWSSHSLRQAKEVYDLTFAAHSDYQCAEHFHRDA